VKAYEREVLFTNTDQPLTKFDYRVIGDFHKGRALARVGDRVGFLEPGGRLVIPARWSLVEAFDQGRALVSVQQRWSAIDPRGRVVIKPRYTYAQVQAKLVGRAVTSYPYTLCLLLVYCSPLAGGQYTSSKGAISLSLSRAIRR
jgi:hypothetical protein